MKRIISLCLLFLLVQSLPITAQQVNMPPPVRGLAIAAPSSGGVDAFVEFMDDVLGPGGINTLVLRVDHNYAYESHPELRNEYTLSKKDVRKLVKAGQRNAIRLIPQINLLGHQSWHSKMGKLLEVYPEFDENPSVRLPDEYEWPNEDGLYCKSYCPLHPEVHGVVFALVDELMDAFEADAFHAGLDEVFYIAEDECPRCAGKDPAVLFAGEVSKIRDHLHARDAELWLWGDRLLDGATTGLGMWEASENDTHGAIDLIPKDVVVCDWHYERADATAAWFAMEGFRVVTCPWNRPWVTRDQLEMTESLRVQATPALRERYHGFMQTVWSPAQRFIDEFYQAEEQAPAEDEKSHVASFKLMLDYYDTRL